MEANPALVPSIFFNTKLNRTNVATNDAMALSYLKSAVLTKLEERAPLHPAMQEDVNQLSRIHPGSSSWQDMDRSAVQHLFKKDTLFGLLKSERSSYFKIEDHQRVFGEWMERVCLFHNNIVLDTFYGVAINEVHCCACGNTFYYFSLFSGIEVDAGFFSVQGKDTVVEIDRLISHSFSPGFEEGSYCGQCTTCSFQKTQRRIYKPPEVLFVSFTENAHPEHLFIKLRHTDLDLKPFSFAGLTKGSYSLRCFVNKSASDWNRVSARNPSKTKAFFADPLKAAGQPLQPPGKLQQELVYYCDFGRQWMHYSAAGLAAHPASEIVDGSNTISFCVFELNHC